MSSSKTMPIQNLLNTNSTEPAANMKKLWAASDITKQLTPVGRIKELMMINSEK
jgi:hypothetical protein